MFCSELILLIIICLVLGLLPISSDFFRLGGHLKRLFQSCIRSGVAWPILLSTAGELLPHLCTIACDKNPSAVFWENFVILLHLTCNKFSKINNIFTPFCGPFRQLTLPGVSPAVCPWMHGLSSQGNNLPRAIIRLLYLTIL